MRISQPSFAGLTQLSSNRASVNNILTQTQTKPSLAPKYSYQNKDTTHFSAGGKGNMKGKDTFQDKERAQREEDEAFLEKRAEWFKTNRPAESEYDGYVTTPDHSDDESRPSARHKAKKENRVFDSNTQSFRPKAKYD